MQKESLCLQAGEDVNDLSFPVGTNRKPSFGRVKNGDRLVIINNSREGYIAGDIASSELKTGYFAVNLQSKTILGGFDSNNVCEIYFVLNNPDAADFVYVENYFSDSSTNPPWATIQGFDASNGTRIPNDNAYGIRVKFQPATISSDWDLQAFPS